MNSKTTPSLGTRKYRVREPIASFVAIEEETLLPFLLAHCTQWSRNAIKQKLRDRYISIDGVATSLYDAVVPAGGRVVIYSEGIAPALVHPMAREVYSDEHLIVIYKERGIPTVAVSSKVERTLFRLVATHLKGYNSKEKIFLLNRLDKDTAGFIVFARNREIQQEILSNWAAFMKESLFAAVVNGVLEPSEGVLSHEGKPTTRARKNAKGVRTSERGFKAGYQTLQASPYASLLEISLLTRHNSIRTELAQIGHPIVGDSRHRGIILVSSKKSGLALQNIAIAFVHPVSKKILRFDEPLPAAMKQLVYARLTRAQKQAAREILKEKEKKRQQQTRNSKTKKNSY